MEGQERDSKKSLKKRSPLWYELPLAFSIIGGIIAYFAIRKDDPKKARNCLIIGGLLIISVIVTWIGFQVAFGVENPFYVAASGSMLPTFEVYDMLVISGHVPFDDIQIGDIIVFQIPSSHDRTIVHRVVSIINDDPRTLRTKGDNNVASIPGTDFPITEKEYVGKVEYVLPKAGFITQFLKPPGNYFYVLAIMIIPIIMHFKFKRNQRKQESYY